MKCSLTCATGLLEDDTGERHHEPGMVRGPRVPHLSSVCTTGPLSDQETAEETGQSARRCAYVFSADRDFLPPNPERREHQKLAEKDRERMGLLDGWPPFYPEFRTGTMFASELFPYVIVVLVLALAFLALAPGIRGKTKPAACRPAGLSVISSKTYSVVGLRQGESENPLFSVTITELLKLAVEMMCRPVQELCGRLFSVGFRSWHVVPFYIKSGIPRRSGVLTSRAHKGLVALFDCDQPPSGLTGARMVGFGKKGRIIGQESQPTGRRLMYCVQVFFAIVVGGIIITPVTTRCTCLLSVRFIGRLVCCVLGRSGVDARHSHGFARCKSGVCTPRLAVSGCVHLCAYGQDWDVASVSTVTAYKARSAAHIPAQISVRIGLKSFNVTMTGMPGNQSSGRLQYSERYALDLREFSSDLHTSHLAGVPYPVIKVAEDMALTKLAEYSTTGHYTMMIMWLSLSLWVLTGLLFSLVRRYGAYCLLLTGITLMLAVVPVASTRLGPAHVIHFPNATLRFSLGWCFWTALVTGCMCTSSGLVFSIVELTKHSRDLESSPNQEEVKVGLGSSGVTNLAFETDEQSAGNTTTSMNKSGLILTEEKPPHRTVDRKQPPTFLAGRYVGQHDRVCDGRVFGQEPKDPGFDSTLGKALDNAFLTSLSEQAPGSQKVWSSGTDADRSSQGFQECGHSGMWVRDMPVDIPFLWTKCLYHS
ncbi:regulation of thyroid hormone proteinration [Branchiostoma belcheri]|nr:regulation of thyroid hormone proteinration [Branchiostoma belcheri]